MNIFFPEHVFLLRCMLKFGVRFMLVGGYAVNHYGYTRTTGDLDLWLDMGNINKDNLVAALAAYGVEPESLEIIMLFDFDQIPPLFYIGEAPRRVDFLTQVSQLTFATAYENAIRFELEGLQVPIIQYHDLILSKINTGRQKDKGDVEELQKINQHRLKK